MTIKELDERIKEIIDFDGDDEAQHSREDDIHDDFIKMIAAQPSKYQEMAKRIVKLRSMKFERWCA